MNQIERNVIVATRKRKDRDYNQNASFYNPKPTPTKGSLVNPVQPRQHQLQIIPPAANTTPSNQLLAGYMAHEFLTRGTLFGRVFDPARFEPGPVPNSDREVKPCSELDKLESGGAYADVAGLLKSDGPHIPGIVNPTQLAQWIHM